MASIASKDYFCSPGKLILLLVPLGMLLISIATLQPVLTKQLPLGPIGMITTYLISHYPLIIPAIFCIAWALHFVESIFAFYVAWTLDFGVWCCIKWSVQTFLYGYFSLRHLLRFESRKKNW
ncbi:hypothetical protein NP493_223g01018 [Ridgeia piscesae]|uniref:Transmembrane protein 254 n=1 Tax=Ridgeia piscesae TaxID=27915 RepID=A0AAD9P0K9_RIDPI|nr:hypothetical protein NP493_223g01018 [Ridgeia piscesae]